MELASDYHKLAEEHGFGHGGSDFYCMYHFIEKLLGNIIYKKKLSVWICFLFLDKYKRKTLNYGFQIGLFCGASVELALCLNLILCSLIALTLLELKSIWVITNMSLLCFLSNLFCSAWHFFLKLKVKNVKY